MPPKRPRPPTPPVQPKPKPPNPNPKKPASASAATPTPTPTPSSIDAITSKLPAPDAAVYAAIHSTGNRGMWRSDISKVVPTLSTQKVTKICNSLVLRRLIKDVHDVANRARKKVMAAEFEPSADVTGGEWYLDGQIDADTVEVAKQHCLSQFHGYKAMTIEMIQKGIEKSNESYTRKQVEGILERLVWDGELECGESDGRGDFIGVPRGKVCYKRTRRKKDGDGGVLGMVPCGVCPRIDECSPDGVISPKTCVYYQKWLNLEF